MSFAQQFPFPHAYCWKCSEDSISFAAVLLALLGCVSVALKELLAYSACNHMLAPLLVEKLTFILNCDRISL